MERGGSSLFELPVFSEGEKEKVWLHQKDSTEH
jgi:hypothetical protein